MTAAPVKLPDEGPHRVVIEALTPEIDCGRFPVKRVEGDRVTVEADVLCDGHDAVACEVLWRRGGDSEWEAAPMEPLGNDRWRGRFVVTEMGTYHYTVRGRVDRFATWRRGLEKKVAAGQNVDVDLMAGADLIEDAAGRAPKAAAGRLRSWAEELRHGDGPRRRARLGLDQELAALVGKYPDRSLATTYDRILSVSVDRERARFSAWYELFPRSWGEGGHHGTFADVIERLPYVAEMGFDVLYLPPIHPIGRTKRKGPNNALRAGSDDPGVPWAIGAEEGGHKAIHPQLGTLEDFRRLVESARELGMEVALDIAFQCSPDHPYLSEHPEWFRHRPDGSVQFAENPPKRYEDIYPFDFETEDWEALWAELRGVFTHWIDQGVRAFRVDNPHTKPFGFWEWCIGSLEQEHPELIFLSEAFTRPKVMYRLAKLGFTQSYTYFAWRNTKWELTEYLTELTRSEAAEFFRPSFWPNTPDILTQYLQTGGRPAFIARLVLASTLAASYGIYGPAFELQQAIPRESGSEEYLDSEKYQIRDWDLEREDSLAPLVARVNAIRRQNPALQRNDTLAFHDVDNDQLIAYSKRHEDNLVLVAVNLDPHHVQSGWVHLPLEELGIEADLPFQVHDLLTDRRYLWDGPTNYLELDPAGVPAHLFRIRRRVRTEEDFDYYM